MDQSNGGGSLEIEPDNREKQKLYFKVEQGEDGGVEVRDEYHSAVFAEGAGKVERPSRMRSGQAMTVGLWAGDWIEFGADGRLDIDGTMANLMQAESIIDSAGRELRM